MNFSNLFSVSSPGYTTGEVDEYISLIQSEYTKVAEQCRSLESMLSVANQNEKELKAQIKEIKAKNNEIHAEVNALKEENRLLFDDCAKLSKVLSDIDKSTLKSAASDNAHSDNILSQAREDAEQIRIEAARKALELSEILESLTSILAELSDYSY